MYTNSDPKDMVLLPFFLPVCIIKNGICGSSVIQRIAEHAGNGTFRASDDALFEREYDRCAKYLLDENSDKIF